MASKRCPTCKLVNPASATRCDCGRSFVDGSIGKPLDLGRAPRTEADERYAHLRKVGFRILLVSLGFIGVGLIVLKAVPNSAEIGGGLGVVGVVGMGVGRLIIKLA